MPYNDTRSHEDERECGFWEIFPSFARLTGFLVSFLGLLVFSIAINCILLYLALRHRYPRQPQYIILANLALCNILIAITPCVYLLPGVLQGKTVILSKWCISFVPTFGNLMMACLLTWTLLAAERYTFICHGIDYLRIVTTRHLRWALAVIWTIVLISNMYQAALICYRFDFAAKPLDTLMCDPLTVEKHTELTYKDLWLLRGPPGCIIIVSISIILTCYLLIFRAASKVSADLRKSSHKAACNVGCYLAMFLVQMLPVPFSLAMSSLDEMYPELSPQSQLLLLILMMVTPSANAATVIYRNTEIKKEFLSLCGHKVGGQEDMEMRELPVRRGRSVSVLLCD